MIERLRNPRLAVLSLAVGLVSTADVAVHGIREDDAPAEYPKHLAAECRITTEDHHTRWVECNIPRRTPTAN